MEELDFQNILTPEQIANLFTDNGDNGGGQPEPEPKEKAEESKEKKEETEENAEESVDVGKLFGGGPEGVGGEDNSQGKEGAGDNGGGSSPNVFSSIASALAEEGVFQTLDSEDVNDTDTVEGLLELFEKELNARFDERQRRINEALNAGVNPDSIRVYENSLRQLNSITNEMLEKEDKDGEGVRRMLIYNDWLNHGFDAARANRETEKSFKSGNDIDDAKDALKNLKEAYKNGYDKIVNEAKESAKEYAEQQKKNGEELHKQIVDDGVFFGGLTFDKGTRQKIYDNISRFIAVDEDGDRITALQKYEIENPIDFLKNVGMLFTLTDGFKNLDRLVKGKVTEEKNKSVRALESMLTGNPEISGEMRNMGVLKDGEKKGKSIFDQGWTIGKV